MTENQCNTEIDKLEVPIHLNTHRPLLIPMNKKRTIIIERDCLRNIRNNLRKVLLKAVIDKKKKLREESRQYEVGTKEMWKVSSKIDALWSAVDKSIYKCPVCGTESSDMTFNPYDKMWYCPECYSKNQAFYKKRGKSHFFP